MRAVPRSLSLITAMNRLPRRRRAVVAALSVFLVYACCLLVYTLFATEEGADQGLALRLGLWLVAAAAVAVAYLVLLAAGYVRERVRQR